MIVPRWEWRAFGGAVAPAERRLGALETERVEESDEIYLLSRTSDASVKLRGGRVDVKRLVVTAPDGLEQWQPVMKASFPMTAAEVRAMLAVLAAAAPPLDRAEYALDQLADEVLAPHTGLVSLRVHKRRAHYAYGGCMAEASELTLRDGTAARTVAVESEDPDRVRAALRKLGVDGVPAVCVARGLKALAGFGAVRCAALDVGTNSVKLHVSERDGDGRWRDVADHVEVTRLGEGLDGTGRIGAAAMARTTDAIDRLAAEARARGADAIAAVGTAGLRAAANADELLAAVRGRSGLELEILPAGEEARLAYLAAAEALGPAAGTRLVFDSGGGSSQFTFGTDGTVEERFSVPVGAVRITERYGLAGAVSAETVAGALAGVAAALERLRDLSPPDAVAGLGGTVTNLAAVQQGLVAYDPAAIEGATLDRDEIDRQIALYRARPAEQRRTIPGLQPGRAEVILAGACIVRTVLDLLGAGALTVSDRGLRHGLIAARFGTTRPSHHPVAAPIPKEEPV